MLENRTNIRWVLHTSCNDLNVLNRIPELTNEELRYCLLKETRKTGMRNLLKEAKKRNFPITKPPTSPAERFLLYDAHVEELLDMIKGSSDEDLDFILAHETRENVRFLAEKEKNHRKEEFRIKNGPKQLLLF